MEMVVVVVAWVSVDFCLSHLILLVVGFDGERERGRERKRERERERASTGAGEQEGDSNFLFKLTDTVIFEAAQRRDRIV